MCRKAPPCLTTWDGRGRLRRSKDDALDETNLRRTQQRVRRKDQLLGPARRSSVGPRLQPRTIGALRSRYGLHTLREEEGDLRRALL